MMTQLTAKFSDGRFWAVFLLSIFLAGLGLAGAQVEAQEPSLPLTQPDAAAGLEIFAERCANCHGPGGGGDGELAANLPKPPAQLNNPDFRLTAVPATLFGRITDGIIDSGMPPFGPASSNPLSEEDRWNLVAAVYSFSTPASSIDMGQTIYEENCLACHGPTGQGDGPDAGGSANLDLTDLSYWFNRSNETVRADLAGEQILEHEFSLSETEQWAVVDYARTFSYAYFNPLAPLEPIESAVISGQITNGTTNEILGEGVVQLRAFTVNFQETLNITTTVGIDGRYQFDLPAVQPDWVFLASVPYNGLNFSSNAGQLSQSQPTLELPITIYETTTDPSIIAIEQIHLVIGFQGDMMQVSELYVISNQGTAVFVGESGNPDQGTIQFDIPEGAESLSFERTLGSLDRTIPATEVIQTETGWADTLPMQPGQGGLNLIISYLLPYSDGLTLNHALYYTTNNANAILPEAGVDVGGGSWNFQGANEIPDGGTFLSYALTGLQAGEELSLTLEGKPDPSNTAGGSAIAPRNPTNELLMGGGILLAAVAAAFLIYRSWQAQPPSAPEYDDEAYEEEEEDPVTQLLSAIAALDDAHERNEISDSEYNRERAQLKTELKSLWK